MTKIAYVHGPAGTSTGKKKGKSVPTDEVRQRAVAVPVQGAYIPYNSLTKGEMHLALMLQQAKILNEYYRQPQYAEAVKLLQNTLYSGVHGVGNAYIGAADTPTLQSVARAINAARRDTRPASGGSIIGRSGGLDSGVHIGDPVIPYEKRQSECLARAGANPGSIARCRMRFDLEKILNDGMEKSGLYLAYGFLPDSSAYPGLATTKTHEAIIAQQELSRVGEFSQDLVQQWLNVGMMRNNSTVAKIQPYDWVQTNSFLMTLPQAATDEIQAILSKYGNLKAQKMGGVDINIVRKEIASQILAVIKKYKQPAIGEPITIALAIIGAIVSLLGGVSQFAKELRTQKQDAFAATRGFGTRAFGPDEGDWDGDGIPNEQDDTPGSAPSSVGISPLVIGGAALAAYLLLK